MNFDKILVAANETVGTSEGSTIMIIQDDQLDRNTLEGVLSINPMEVCVLTSREEWDRVNLKCTLGHGFFILCLSELSQGTFKQSVG